MTTEQLDALRMKLRTQDNAFTAEPLFVVFEEHRVYGIEPQYTDDFEWFQADDHSIAADSDEVKILERLRTDGRPLSIGGFDFVRIGYKAVRKFATACLTRQGAEDYIACNGHNLTKPYIYVESLYRNAEMLALRNHLMGDKP
jgi:hypothetical protein